MLRVKTVKNHVWLVQPRVLVHAALSGAMQLVDNFQVKIFG